MTKQWVVALFALNIFAAAHAGEQEAYSGIAADAVSTGAALAAPGVVEMNPLGWATLPIRLAVIEHAKRLPREDGQPLMDAVSASGWGAAANNLLVLAGVSSAAPIVGLAVGYAVWKAGENEREFWRLCAVHKQVDAQVQCNFKPWTAEEVTRIAQAQERAVRVAQALPAPVR